MLLVYVSLFVIAYFLGVPWFLVLPVVAFTYGLRASRRTPEVYRQYR